MGLVLSLAVSLLFSIYYIFINKLDNTTLNMYNRIVFLAVCV
jgi:hypothetical protein